MRILTLFLLVTLLAACASPLEPTSPAPILLVVSPPPDLPTATPYRQPTPKPPDSAEPAAGICAQVEGQTATLSIVADVPDPRCLQVSFDSRLAVTNQTEAIVQGRLANFPFELAPGATYSFDYPLGAFLAPGVHRLELGGAASAPELWVRQPALLAPPLQATPEMAAPMQAAPMQAAPMQAAPGAQQGKVGALGLHPPDARTGVAQVDAVLQAFAACDPQTLLPWLAFSAYPCTNVEGLGGPPKCAAGEAEGAPVEALPILGSEGTHLRRSEITPTLQTLEQVSGMLGAYRAPAPLHPDPYFPAGEYALLYRLDLNGQPTLLTLRLQDGLVVRLDFGWDALPQEALDLPAEAWLLPLIQER